MSHYANITDLIDEVTQPYFVPRNSADTLTPSATGGGGTGYLVYDHIGRDSAGNIVTWSTVGVKNPSPSSVDTMPTAVGTVTFIAIIGIRRL